MHIQEIIAEVLKQVPKTKEQLQKIKLQIAKKYSLPKIPTNSEILENVEEDDYEIMQNILRLKPTRSLSGVVVCAVMTSPEKCPHGKCLYCPGGVEKGTAQSYTGKEPASLRASMYNFDPYIQTKKRLEQLKAIAHPIDKVDLIIMGGTFTARDENYQAWFIKRCFDAMNSMEKNGNNSEVKILKENMVKNNLAIENTKEDIKKKNQAFETSENAIKNKITIEKPKNVFKENFMNYSLENEGSSIQIAQLKNEKANSRCIGLTIETRADYCKEKDIQRILNYGATRVELGVQTIYDDILEKVKRGHNVQETINATKLVKDYGLKVCLHLMPNLPYSSYEKDLQCFKEIFTNENFKPDMLKIYPCLVIEGTELYEIWKKGEYKLYDDEKLIELLIEVKKAIPKWIRIQRIQRDIPVQLILDGCKKSNLREIVKQRLDEIGEKCHCIRCREIGQGERFDKKGKKGKDRKFAIKNYSASARTKFKNDFDSISLKMSDKKTNTEKKKIDNNSIGLKRIDYKASGGEEIFLSYEDKNEVLICYSRLRIPSENSLFFGNAIIRELKVFGEVVPIEEEAKEKQFQHRGFGKALMNISEKIAKEEFSAKNLFVNSGVGAREYYRKLDYERDGHYMKKKL